MSKLFDPVKIGAFSLRNRIVMAPLTRMRTGETRTPAELNAEYYAQRASAGMIIAEAVSVSPQGVGYGGTPGIWNDAQVDGWRKVTSAVQAAGGIILAQLWHVGRISDPQYLNGDLPVAPSAIAPEGHVATIRPKKAYEVPRALALEELPSIIEDVRRAAENAKRAGFDGVELHGANGYLFDQFLHNGSNHRTDGYGGSIENRARLLLEAVDAMLSVWPADRVGVHLNLMSSSHSMSDTDPKALFSYVAQQLDARKIAFIFGRESVDGDAPRLGQAVRKLFSGAYIANEGLTRESAERLLDENAADAVSFGRPYISNPDLVDRFKRNLPLSENVTATIYGSDSVGYTDYPAAAA